jgi:hypothetical protein
MDAAQTFAPGIVSSLPEHIGDGFTWGGDLIVTFGDLSICLGGQTATRGVDPKVAALASLLAQAPALLEACRGARKALAWAAEKHPGLVLECEILDAAIAKAIGAA